MQYLNFSFKYLLCGHSVRLFVNKHSHHSLTLNIAHYVTAYLNNRRVRRDRCPKAVYIKSEEGVPRSHPDSKNEP